MQIPRLSKCPAISRIRHEPPTIPALREAIQEGDEGGPRVAAGAVVLRCALHSRTRMYDIPDYTTHLQCHTPPVFTERKKREQESTRWQRLDGRSLVHDRVPIASFHMPMRS